MIDLKPCPFCGWNKARVTERKIAGSYHYYDKRDFVKIRFAVMCNKCKAKGASVVSKKLYHEGDENHEALTNDTIMRYHEEAIEAWNRRVTDERSDNRR